MHVEFILSKYQSDKSIFDLWSINVLLSTRDTSRTKRSNKRLFVSSRRRLSFSLSLSYSHSEGSFDFRVIDDPPISSTSTNYFNAISLYIVNWFYGPQSLIQLRCNGVICKLQRCRREIFIGAGNNETRDQRALQHHRRFQELTNAPRNYPRRTYLETIYVRKTRRWRAVNFLIVAPMQRSRVPTIWRKAERERIACARKLNRSAESQSEIAFYYN